MAHTPMSLVPRFDTIRGQDKDCLETLFAPQFVSDLHVVHR